jgi:hypothetical protein
MKDESVRSHLPFVILLGVQDAKNDNSPTENLVENLVREAAQTDAAKVEVVEAFALGVAFKKTHRGSDFVEEFVSEPGCLCSPIPCVREVQLGLWSNENEPTHECLRRRASTSRHGAPAEGSAS